MDIRPELCSATSENSDFKDVCETVKIYDTPFNRNAILGRFFNSWGQQFGIRVNYGVCNVGFEIDFFKINAEIENVFDYFQIRFF